MPAGLLDREEYVEQAHFFRLYRERLEENVPAQDILAMALEEILVTTRLPMALDFLRAEMLHKGRLSDGMAHLKHYFTAFQTLVMARSEEDKARFDQATALLILEREAQYRAGTPVPAGLFVYQFESVARNRLGYDRGMAAIAADPLFDDDWREWIRRLRGRLGSAEFADLIYFRSEQHVLDRRRRSHDDSWSPGHPIFFGAQEGRIAKASKGRDPLYLFAALQRHLGYPAVPRPKRKPAGPDLPPALEQRLHRLEQRLKLLEGEMKEGIDLGEFTTKPPDFSHLDDPTA